MYLHIPRVRALLSALFLAVSAEAVPVEIRFTAIIDESPFLTPGYNVGSSIGGWYTYDSEAVPLESGNNYATYSMLGMHLFFGTAEYASSHGEFNLWRPPEPFGDNYILTGYSLSGPEIEGFLPAFADINMQSTDRSIYAITPPPIDFPDPAFFEQKALRVGFLAPGPPPLGYREIDAHIDYIARVPDGVSSIWLFGSMFALMCWMRKWRVR